MGPLANPAHVTRQLLGIARPDFASVYAAALESLGAEGAAVVSGEEGLDELSGAGPSIVLTVGDVDLPDTIVPEDAGLARSPLDQLRGGDPAFNALALRRLLKGDAGAYRDAVLLNTAAAFVIAGRVADLAEGAALGAETIDRGAAETLLDRWIAYS
jgi:anthranilate phosphoribosyltransferase